MSPIRVLDSRRLTGANLLLDGPGAVLDVALQDVDAEAAIAAWRERARRLLEAVGWGGARTASRAYPGGASLAFQAPLDVLYAATEVNEAAWDAAARALEAAPADASTTVPDPAVVARLRQVIERERKPELLEAARRATEHGVTLLADDRRVSVGLGVGSRAWPVEDTRAAVPRVPWAEVRDVPVALVTGTNGKTTTVRMLAAAAREAGRIAGATSTDRVTVGDEIVAVGDYSGPNGARSVLRDRRVEVAVLEVARGGLLRRGLPLARARAALVTNVANDHLGEFGIHDLPSLADAKLVVAKAIGPEGRVVLNADDPLLRERGLRLAAPVTWFSLEPSSAVVREHLARGGEACLVDGDALVVARGETRHTVVRIGEMPAAWGGAARHNVANALAAIGVARALGLDDAAIRRALIGFDSSPERNPGRTNVWTLGGVTAVVDFAHNPHGLEALARMAGELPARRRGIVLGQAGDRDDASIRALAAAAWTVRPDRVFIKEMEEMLRGREPGAVPELLERELRRLGAPAEGVARFASERDAVLAALRWARPGDLLLLTTHVQRGEVIALVERLAGGIL